MNYPDGVNSFDAYKSCRGADAAHWLEMHRGGPLIVDRKSGKRMIHVPRASGVHRGRCAAEGPSVGPDRQVSGRRVDEAMDKPDKEHFDNGLAARLLFSMPPRRPKRWTEDELPWQTEAALETLVGRLLALDMQRTRTVSPSLVTFR